MVEELEQHEWHADIIYYLKNLICLDYRLDHKKRALRLKASKYYLVQNGSGWKTPKRLVLRCVDDQESKKIRVRNSYKFMRRTLCSNDYNSQDS